MTWQYYLILLLTFLGIVFGLVIGLLAKEEIKPGKKYFNILRHIIFIAILVLFFIKNPSLIFVIIIALTIAIFSFSRYRETLYYYALSIIFFLSWAYNGFAIIAPLVFLYGLPLGSLFLYEHFKEKKIKKLFGKLLIRYGGFLVNGVVIGLIVFLI